MKKLSFLFAMIFAISMAMGQDNVTTVDQIGDDHQATINQGGEFNRAYVEQTADAEREGEDLARATVIQNGDENFVNLKQRAFFGDARANIIMDGDENKLFGTSAGQAFHQNHGLNIVDVLMEGNRNVLYATRGEAQKNVNTFLLNVDGNDNRVGMEQEFGWADVDIKGDLNRITLSQYGRAFATWERADVDILGDSNVVGVDQQDGNNRAFVNIAGSSNNASVWQTGGEVYP
jgi:hypothetical protein